MRWHFKNTAKLASSPQQILAFWQLGMTRLKIAPTHCTHVLQ